MCAGSLTTKEGASLRKHERREAVTAEEPCSMAELPVRHEKITKAILFP